MVSDKLHNFGYFLVFLLFTIISPIFLPLVRTTFSPDASSRFEIRSDIFEFGREISRSFLFRFFSVFVLRVISKALRFKLSRSPFGYFNFSNDDMMCRISASR